jgi:DNA-binding transcriptional ArsR family regulator
MPPEDEPFEETNWVATWKENSSAFDRVKSVTLTLSEPQSATWIAEEAAVSPNTARDHLRRLIELGVVATAEEDGVTQYSPDPLYIRLRDIRELVTEKTKRQLTEQAAESKEAIAKWQSEYDVESPDSLRERAVQEEVSADQAHEYIRIASEWESIQYRLLLLQDAIENYDTWTSDSSTLHA